MGKKTKYGGKKKDDAGGPVVVWDPELNPPSSTSSWLYIVPYITQGGK